VELSRQPEILSGDGDQVWQLIKADPVRYNECNECSGFQFGWALNAVRAIVELPPVPNPAILTIGDAG